VPEVCWFQQMPVPDRRHLEYANHMMSRLDIVHILEIEPHNT
jgi:hypothetical protein